MSTYTLEVAIQDNFRKQYKPLTPEQGQLVSGIKSAADVLYSLIDTIDNREMSIAKTNLEQAVMWAVKGATD
jgi:hypothetical protein